MTELAKEAFASRNYRLAVEMYERSLKQQAPSFEVLVGYGDSLAKCGRIRESIGVYSKCLAVGSVAPERLKHLANALLDELSGAATTTINFRRKIETSFACPLCEGTLCQPVTSNCGHTYCKNCVEPGKSCRVCGQKIVTVSETNVLVQRLVEKWWPREAEASRARHEGDILMKEGHLGQALERYNLAVHLVGKAVAANSKERQGPRTQPFGVQVIRKQSKQTQLCQGHGIKTVWIQCTDTMEIGAREFCDRDDVL
ncbi:LON peptidase N-terminal domain and RING finger protein [Apis cerana cerana]|uniref:LON peptidase N-terminal domain and RING finger protein n=1 Tax=Apis cerana cerana TaxID=94128 RepID=A0A2A3EFE1_APICC|nr:LON peptidase N-terminal domain and RING finger protein [Apis cerana cerana]